MRVNGAAQRLWLGRVAAETRSYRKRCDSNNPCQNTGCWDYTKDDKVELFGKACDEVKGSAAVNVKIVVGCDTVIG